MGEEINKFDQIANIFSQFTEENKEYLIETAESLVQIQHDSESMIANNKTRDKRKGKRDERKV